MTTIIAEYGAYVDAETVDKDHDDALRADQSDVATVQQIQAIENARGIHWGYPRRAPLTYAKVKAAFDAIDSGFQLVEE